MVMKLKWMRSPEDMRYFISTHALPGAELKPWESNDMDCGELIGDVCERYKLEELTADPLSPRFRATVHLKSGHWSFATSTSKCLAACIALCRATEERLKTERTAV